MRRYFDLSKKELSELTDAQIEFLISLEIAEAGIAPVECPAKPSLEDVGIAKNVVAYKVKGCIVKSAEDVAQLMKMQVFSSHYDYNCGYEYEWLEEDIQAQPTQCCFYHEQDVLRLKEILQDNKRKMAEYTEKKNTYDKYLKQTGEHRNAVFNAVNAATSYYREVALAQKTWEHHLQLAENDHAVAMRFFKAAYKDRPDLLLEVLPKEAITSDESPLTSARNAG
jgi:hypothetical protein